MGSINKLMYIMYNKKLRDRKLKLKSHVLTKLRNETNKSDNNDIKEINIIPFVETRLTEVSQSSLKGQH